MIVTYIRSSSYSCHKLCENKYFIEYVLGWRGPSNKKADMGTIVHKVLEVVALAKEAEQNNKKSFVDKEFLGRVKVNFSIDNMIKKVYDYYTNAFKHHKWTSADFRFVTTSVMKIVNDKIFNPRNRIVVAAEKQFDFLIEEDWAHYKYELDGKILEGQLGLKGTVDLTLQMDNSDDYEIVDWKTGKRIDWGTGAEKNYEVLEKDFQLRLYHLVMHRLYPSIENIFITIHYLNDGGPFTIQLGRSDIPDTMEMIRKKFNEIKDTQIPKLKQEEKWFCKKICHFGKTTFEETNIKPLVQKKETYLTQPGETMTMCDQVHYSLKHRDMQSVIKNMSKEGHTVDYYHAPGSTDTK